ncbi:ATP-binding protein [Limnohabitans sp. 2KL-51]|uniref:ATP-binding protein n=1 Tax=Limnohabitans sp. 2KL-51 TaxID=1977911 RepID=UPI000D3608FC|nr:ATP-binding protein [Limnohabitans sp. 2KL-51]PUE45557.1 AAA family ATPase [Limnohabitans sp. 2KL-51]
MNPITNPYNPGAGTPPPELAGRNELREKVRICIERLRIGNSAKSLILVGLRGVGKTVLLDRMRLDAEGTGIQTLRIEAPENKSLPAMLAPELRKALLRMSTIESAKEVSQRALRALAGFAKGLKLKFADIEVGFDYAPEPGLADNGELESDLTALLVQTGEAAKAAGTVMVMFIDELQYVKESQFAALISALHRCAHLRLPITLVGAGLPQLLALAGEAKSYSERLFEYPQVDKLNTSAAMDALRKPAQQLGVHYTDDAALAIVEKTQGYPYFLQEWGKHTWDVATTSPITLDVVKTATQLTIAGLDESFFKVRLERTTPSERRYLRAMADLGPGPHRSGDIANQLLKTVSTQAPVRSSLIRKGIVWSPTHGDTAFTVPLFHEYLLRTVPTNS